MLQKYRPQIMATLKVVGEVVIDQVRKIIIRIIEDGIVGIFVNGEAVTSDGSAFMLPEKRIYAVLDQSPPQINIFKDGKHIQCL